ncbi:hypothetical protein VTG60DRAFT_450 [Thermothelomyces hinnuleus]
MTTSDATQGLTEMLPRRNLPEQLPLDKKKKKKKTLCQSHMSPGYAVLNCSHLTPAHETTPQFPIVGGAYVLRIPVLFARPPRRATSTIVNTLHGYRLPSSLSYNSWSPLPPILMNSAGSRLSSGRGSRGAVGGAAVGPLGFLEYTLTSGRPAPAGTRSVTTHVLMELISVRSLKGARRLTSRPASPDTSPLVLSLTPGGFCVIQGCMRHWSTV